MTAISASPMATSQPTSGIAPLSGSNNAATGKGEGAADFASMLTSLKQRGAPPDEALTLETNGRTKDIAAVLKKLGTQTEHPVELDTDNAKLDIAAMLGQLQVQNTSLTPVVASHPAIQGIENRGFQDKEDNPRCAQGMLKALESDTKAKGLDDAPGLIKREITDNIFKLPATDKTSATDEAITLNIGEQRHANVHAERAKLDIATPVQSPKWSDDVGQRIVWMAKNNLQEAQISVTPRHLGPIEISLSLTDDQATARFYSPHAEVRDLLEQAMPRLREMMAGAGFQLGQSDVGAQSQQAFQQFANKQNTEGNTGRTFSEEHPSLQSPNAVEHSESIRILQGNGLVDTFV